MGNPYGQLLTPTLSVGACALYNNTTLIQAAFDNCTQCAQLAATHPNLWHCAAVLPMVTGGFMLSQTSIRAMRLWIMEAFDYLFRK